MLPRSNQVLALEFAVQSSLGQSDWLIHIDPDEALVFNGNGKKVNDIDENSESNDASSSRGQEGKDEESTSLVPSASSSHSSNDHSSTRGSASCFFAGMPEALDEVQRSSEGKEEVLVIDAVSAVSLSISF